MRFLQLLSSLASYLQLNIKPGKSSKRENARKKMSSWISEFNPPSNQTTALGKWGKYSNLQLWSDGTQTFSFPSLSCTQSEGPIAGPVDEAVTTSCQVSPFIVRKHPCKGAYPTVSAQEQQITENTPRFSHYKLKSLPSSPTRSLEKG